MKRSWHIGVFAGCLIVAACAESATEKSTAQPDSPDAAAPATRAAPTLPSPAPYGEVCAAMCPEPFQAAFWPQIDDATLQKSTLSVCRNAECFSTTLAEIPLSTASDSGYGKEILCSQEREQSSAPLIQIIIWGRETPDEPRRMNVSYRPWIASDWKDGDVYELTLVDDKGTVFLHRQTTAAYAVTDGCVGKCGTANLDGGS